MKKLGLGKVFWYNHQNINPFMSANKIPFRLIFKGMRSRFSFVVLAALIIFCWGLVMAPAGAEVPTAPTDTVFDGDGIDGGLKTLFPETSGTGIIRSDDLILVTLGWVRFALALLGTVAFVAFLWAGALYVTAFVNAQNAETAKKVMIWTATGIIVILMSYAIVSTLIRATIEPPPTGIPEIR